MNEDKRELAELLERHAREMAAHFLGHVNSIQDAALSKLLRTASEALTAVGAHLQVKREEGRPEPVKAVTFPSQAPRRPDHGEPRPDVLDRNSAYGKPDIEHRTVRTHTGGLYCYAISGDVSHGEHQELERPDGPPSQALNLSRIITDQSDGKVVFTDLRIDGLYYHWETVLRKLAAKQTLRIEAGQRVVVRLAYLGKEPRGVSVHLYG